MGCLIQQKELFTPAVLQQSFPAPQGWPKDLPHLYLDPKGRKEQSPAHLCRMLDRDPPCPSLRNSHPCPLWVPALPSQSCQAPLEFGKAFLCEPSGCSSPHHRDDPGSCSAPPSSQPGLEALRASPPSQGRNPPLYPAQLFPVFKFSLYLFLCVQTPSRWHHLSLYPHKACVRRSKFWSGYCPILENCYKQFLSKTKPDLWHLLYSSLHQKLSAFCSSLSTSDKDGNEATNKLSAL